MMRARLMLAGFMVMITCLCSCATTIIPPVDPIDPVNVYLIDYGRHVSLLLPLDETNELIEYAYGDWNWFALDRSRILDVFPTLFWPTPAALGRWEWALPDNAEAVRDRISCEELLQITVARADAQRFLSELEDRFMKQIETLHYQPRYQFDFVRDDSTYHLLHNCNHVTARWLERMGCEVRGSAMLADFAVQPQ